MTGIKVNDHRLPVTALQFYSDNILLAGEGSWLSIFDIQTKKRLAKCQIFQASVLHGIRLNEESHDIPVCIFGGKSLRVIGLRESSIALTGDEVILQDWIQDVHWLQEETGWKFGIALSHNFVILYDYQAKTVLCEVHCEDKCILYSGLLLGNSWHRLVLAAGTVFNQVVIWAVEGQRSHESQAKVIHRLEGHRGVIFSMDFSWERKVLCSVSDDRSLRLWQMVLPSEGEGDGCLDWERAKFEPLFELYGHHARVWDCKLLTDCMVSVGEDACCVLWDYNGNVMNKFKGHKGRSIWSFATRSTGCLATGGGDCGIRLYNFQGQGQQDSKVTSRSLVPPEVNQGQTFFPRTVKLLDCDNVLIMTDEGILYKCTLPVCEWTVLLQSEAFKSYCVLEVLPSHEIIALGGVHGDLIIIRGGMKTEYKIFDGKIHSVCWLGSASASVSSLSVLLSGPNGLMKLYTLEVRNDCITLEHQSDYHLPPAKQCWATCALLLEEEDILLCGDRSGSVHVYRISDAEPKQKFAKIHGSNGVTDMCLHEGHIWSGGRDGQIKEFNIADEGQVELLHSNKVLKGLQWISKLNFSENDQLVLGFHNNNFVAYSSLQHQVVIKIPCGGGHRAWDCSFADDHQMSFFYIKSREVVCCQATMEDNVTILQASLHGREVSAVATIFAGDQPIVATGSEDTTVNILRLGSEKDAFEILHTLTAHISSVRTICVVPSVAKSKKSSKECPSMLMFTAGGRAEILAWRVSQEFDEAKVNDASEEGASASGGKPTSQRHSNVQYEHLATFSLVQKRRRKARQNNLDPETRIMSVTAYSIQEITESEDERSVYIVACGCSDGFLRVYLFNEDQPTFQLLFQSEFHNHCLLKVGHVILGAANQRTAYIYSTATDGRVAFWDTSGIVSKLLKERDLGSEELWEMGDDDCNANVVSVCCVLSLHQSGVNAAAVHRGTDDEFLLATGGDDNCLSLVKLRTSERGKMETVSVFKEPNAHVTEITGIQFCTDKSVISASIDQRVTLWHIDGDNEKLEFIASKFINVADISHLESLTKGPLKSFIASGQGLQTLTVASHAASEIS